MARPGKVRIIAGHWRGRKLDVVDVPDLRPSPDRVRETLFNWLQAEIAGAVCLDLFTGTGALAFEALSRGASHVTLIDSHHKIVQSLKLQAQALGSEQHDIVQADALSWLEQSSKTFDIIFLDPPFKLGLVEQCCDVIAQRDLLKPNGMIYIEAEKELALPEGWKVLKQKHAGQVQSILITKQQD